MKLASTNPISNQNFDQLHLQHQKEIQMIRGEWQQETIDQIRLQQLRQRVKELDAKIINLEMARDSKMGAGMDPLEDLLYKKDKQIWDSDQRIRGMQEQMRFTTGETPMVTTSRVSMEIDRTMNFLEAELGSILHGHHISTTLAIPPSTELYGLAGLIGSISGMSDSETKTAQYLRRWRSKFEPEILIKTLTLAAIRDWVFYSTFPQPEENNSWLLTAYRDAIMLQGLYINLRTNVCR